ncbi:MAG: carcinine hydrolase/isopenicillin-N N-acyltransferase family protein [Fimbriimonadaceae bacterium]
MKQLLLVLSLLVSATVPACTIFVVARGGEVFAAGNEDEANDPSLSEHYVRFVPASEEKGTLGFVAFGYKKNPFSDEAAMNEAGLFFDYNALEKLDVPREGKPKGNFSSVYKMLTTCKNVQQAVSFLEGLDLPFFSAGQMVVGDATGASAIIERQATTWRRKGMDYQIGTNFRTSTTPLAQITCPRYKTCDARLGMNKPLTVDALSQVLNQVKAAENSGSMTWYSVICDLKRGQVNLYRKGNFERRTTFSLAEELKRGARKLDMDEFIASQVSS